ncbi:hypothetical protein ARMGADRAFT_537618 [Armillaria gallica]|uniref:Uncharacterized protein n=1 Tax=Armillaria gallica TaxID=47427 RepID=A0A2H3DAT4_ARMGA|nr:hypothetical protein ARMGADRAFT_537618 [Armillaria gallica]
MSLVSAYAIPLSFPVYSFRCNQMGRVYGTRNKLWQDGRENQCAYVRPEFVLTTCALLFECLGNQTHSRRRGLMSECNYRSRVECSYFWISDYMLQGVHTSNQVINAHDCVAGVFYAIQ